METITYNLKSNQEKSSLFYKDLILFTDGLIESRENYFGQILEDYEIFIQKNNVEKQRHRDEYYLEILMLGVFWNSYNTRIHYKSSHLCTLFKSLYLLRSKVNQFKPFIDNLRGYLATKLLDKQYPEKSFSVQNFKRLLDWMDCTNEFNEEVKRLRNWHRFLKTQGKAKASLLLSSISSFANAFEHNATKAFSKYTSHVASFLNMHHPSYRFKENYFFTGRKEVEYHLNMVGAELLNRVLKTEFHQTECQSVLLPTCMANSHCKAKKKGSDITCVHCSKNCKVSEITQALNQKGIRTVLIPHSSKFTQWLKPYADQKDTGLVGVACVLNLLKGGYEMKNLNIPSQCVFLDHCGCKKHWHKTGITTDINTSQLHATFLKEPCIDKAMME